LRVLPTLSVCRHAPLLASQILTVLSLDADASLVESCEKATELTKSLWSSSVCRHAPLLASQILTVLSLDADASLVESCEKATELTLSLWPSSVCRHALHPSLRVGLILISSGSSCWNSCLIRLPVGLNSSADA
jgi:hypothetical protein